MTLPQTLEAIEAEIEEYVDREVEDAHFNRAWLKAHLKRFVKPALLRALSTAREGTRVEKEVFEKNHDKRLQEATPARP